MAPLAAYVSLRPAVAGMGRLPAMAPSVVAGELEEEVVPLLMAS
jgi:hypothetical protein